MKKRLKLVALGTTDPGTRFWFAKGHLVGREGTVIYQRKKGMPVTGFHFGHEYDHKAQQRTAYIWKSVWIVSNP